MVRLPFRPRRGGPPRNENTDTDFSKKFPENDAFYPSIWDVLKVKWVLQWKLKEGFPVELVDQIIDEAEYWPSIEHRMAGEGRKIIRQDRDEVLLKTAPLCYDRKSLEQPSTPKILPHRGAHPCRKIMFQICSNDQGSRSAPAEDSYSSTWTWFDIEVIHDAHKLNMYVDGEEQEILENEKGLEKRSFGPDDPLLLPRSTKVQANPKRVGETQNHSVTWRYTDDIESDSPEAFEIDQSKGRGRDTLDGRVVRELDIGDSVALWARARFPGWQNHVHWASVRVFWAV